MTIWLPILCLGLLLPCAAAAAGAEPDSVRTNLWLTEALLDDVFTEAAAVLPADAARVGLLALGSEPADELARLSATRVLRDAGHEVFLAVEDSTAAVTDYELAYRVQEVELEYPGSERTLGLWRRWVERRLGVSVLVEVTVSGTGQVLFSESVRRRVADRVPDDDFDAVQSEVYPFTNAATGESGWHRRTEELVVLGTLAGLVAVYFANTGD